MPYNPVNAGLLDEHVEDAHEQVVVVAQSSQRVQHAGLEQAALLERRGQLEYLPRETHGHELGHGYVDGGVSERHAEVDGDRLAGARVHEPVLEMAIADAQHVLTGARDRVADHELIAEHEVGLAARRHGAHEASQQVPRHHVLDEPERGRHVLARVLGVRESERLFFAALLFLLNQGVEYESVMDLVGRKLVPLGALGVGARVHDDVPECARVRYPLDERQLARHRYDLIGAQLQVALAALRIGAQQTVDDREERLDALVLALVLAALDQILVLALVVAAYDDALGLAQRAHRDHLQQQKQKYLETNEPGNGKCQTKIDYPFVKALDFEMILEERTTLASILTRALLFE